MWTLKFNPKMPVGVCLLTGLLNISGAMGQGASPLRLTSGPMVGATEQTETQIWVQTTVPAMVTIRFWPVNQPAHARERHAQTLAAQAFLTAHIKLDQLLPNTRYQYEIKLNGQPYTVPYSTAFKTQPTGAALNPPPLRFAFGSCAYVNDPKTDPPNKVPGGEYHIYNAIKAKVPDLMLWLGDNIYYREPDFYSVSGMNQRYQHSRAQVDIQPFLANVPQYAIWDDHDFGGNDADWTYRMRDQTMALFKAYWANPAWGHAGTTGIFSRFEWGDAEFFLLDNRSYRAPFMQKDPARPHLGPAQLKWLKDSLASSRATFKFIVSGNQVLNTLTPSENYPAYQQEFQSLMDYLKQQGVEGVVILSGDRHHAEILKQNRPGTYPLYEFTSSPLTSTAFAPFIEEKELPIRQPGTLYSQRNFGMVLIQGPKGQRVLTLELYNSKGEKQWAVNLPEQTFKNRP